MTDTTERAEALRLADELDDYARGDEYQRATEQAADMLRTQAERIAELERGASLAGLLGLLADIRAACGDKGQRMQPELVDHIRQGFAERDKLRAEVEMLRVERERWYTSFEHVSRILSGIHALMYPAPFTLSDGRTVVFRPKDPGPHEILQALSDRIRAIPDEVAAIDLARTHKETK